NVHFDGLSNITHELKIDQSIAHDGVCLSGVQIEGSLYRVTAIVETLEKTNVSQWSVGKKVSLERCRPANGRFDGRFVQGQLDQSSPVEKLDEKEGSYVLDFYYEATMRKVTVEKRSVTVNGISLTCFNSEEG